MPNEMPTACRRYVRISGGFTRYQNAALEKTRGNPKWMFPEKQGLARCKFVYVQNACLEHVKISCDITFRGIQDDDP